MIDGTKILTVKRAQNILSPEDVNRLYELYTNYEDVEDFSKVVTLDDIAAKDYDLSPNKYVEYHKEEIRPYAEVLAEFKAAYEESIRMEHNVTLESIAVGRFQSMQFIMYINPPFTIRWIWGTTS